jgi:ubiquinone/menaquinone biosynthesis C-methylase UbiE
MKVNDSGMPEEQYWNSLFDIPLIVSWLDLKAIADPIVEIGCGYGTFTLPVALETEETIFAFDIEPAMIQTTREHLKQANIRNVHLHLRDVIDQTTGLERDSAGMVLLFNILHFEEQRAMLEETCRILKPSGIIAIIHWRKDIETPRGPSYDLRPDKRIILDSVQGLDLSIYCDERILQPYHWGIQLIKGRRK